MSSGDDGSSERRGVRRLFQRSAITLVGAVFGAVAMFGSEILTARFLGADLYGGYALAVVFARVGEQIAMFGLGFSLLHFIPLYLSADDRRRLSGTVYASVVVPLGAGGALVAGMWAGAPWLAAELFDDPRLVPYLRFIAVAIPFLGLSQLLGIASRGFGHAVYHVVIRDIVPRIAFPILLCALLWSRPAPVWIAAAYVFPYVLASLAGLVSVLLFAADKIRGQRPLVPVRDLYDYSAPILVTTLLSLIMGQTDYLMIGILLPTEDAGLFRGSLAYTRVLQLLIHAVAASAAHLFPLLVKERRHDELGRVYQRSTLWLTGVSAPVTVLLLLNRRDLLGLLGPEFTPAAMTLAVLLAAHLLRTTVGIAPHLLFVSGQQGWELRHTLIATVLNVALNAIAIPRYGILGAAGTTLVVHALLAILRAARVKASFGISTWTPRTLRPLLVAGAVGSLLYGAAVTLGVDDGSGYAALAVRLPIMALVLGAAGWRFGGFRDERLR